jgi:hypothetical protein
VRTLFLPANARRRMPAFRLHYRSAVERVAFKQALRWCWEHSPSNRAAMAAYYDKGDYCWAVCLRRIDGQGGLLGLFQPVEHRLADMPLIPNAGPIDAYIHLDTSDLCGLTPKAMPVARSMHTLKLAVYLSHEINHAYLGRHLWNDGVPESPEQIAADPVYRTNFLEWSQRVVVGGDGTPLRWWFGDAQGREITTLDEFAAMMFAQLSKTAPMPAQQRV